MTKIVSRRVIHLDPFTVKDDTLAALEDEIKAQANDDIDDIHNIDKLVLDATDDGGLDSHATVFVPTDGGVGNE